mgnify:CR=1 FL=1
MQGFFERSGFARRFGIPRRGIPTQAGRDAWPKGPLILATAALVLAAPLHAATAPSTLLFVDDHDVLYRSGTKRVFHPAKRFAGNPVIAQDKPWELTISYNSVYRDPATGKYQLWYQALSAKSPELASVCYAESMDGVKWIKPELGLFSFDGQKTNMVLDGEKGHYGASVLVDPRDPDPERRYKMAFYRVAEVEGRETMGLAVAFSPDGIHWKVHPKVPLLTGSYGKRLDPPFADEVLEDRGIPLSVSDVIDVMYDEPRGVYAIYSKTWLDTPDGKSIWKRGVVRTESKDFVNWSTPQLVIQPDEFDGTGIEYRPPIGKVHPNRRGVQLRGGPVFFANDVYFSLLQKMDGETTGQMPCELAISRNGLDWNRPFRKEDFIPVDADKDKFDGGCLWTNSTPVYLEDEIRFYYGGYSGLWNGDLFRSPSGIGFASIRKDRFAGIRPMEDIGQVTLKARDLSGVEEILLNANAEQGTVKVEILTDGGFRVKGFTKDDAVALTGDKRDLKAAWKDAKLSDLPSGKYWIRIHLDQAEVFACTLR